MTTPNLGLYLPKTYILERKTGSYADVAMMTLQGTSQDYFYLPKGMSVITVAQTAMGSTCELGVWLYGRGYAQQVSETVKATDGASRVWNGIVSNLNTGNAGLWLKIQSKNVNTVAMNTGSVSVQLVNVPPET